MINNFLSNKKNLWALVVLTYFIVGYVCISLGLTKIQLFLIYMVIGVSNGVTYLFGYSRGIIFTTQNRPKFVQELDKLNKLIKKQRRDNSCKQCNRNDGTCGCVKQNTNCDKRGCNIADDNE